MKLAQNWVTFSELLLTTRDSAIVEQSARDSFWGAKPVDEHALEGMNVLGRLLMDLRDLVKSNETEALIRVDPIDIPNFLLDGREIGIVTLQNAELTTRVPEIPAAPCDGRPRPNAIQLSLFPPRVPPDARPHSDRVEDPE